MTKPTYRIRDWKKHFETSESKKRVGALQWVAVPTKQDGKGRRRLLRLTDGPALFGAWNALLQIAARCPTRGTLADDDGPLDADDLSDKTDLPAELFDQLFDVLTDKSQRIMWLSVDGHGEICRSLPESAEKSCLHNSTGQDKTEHEHDKTGQDKTEHDSDSSEISIEGNSGSDSPRHKTREHGRMTFGQAVIPLIGLCGNGGGRHPQGSKQYEADLTCTRQLFDDVWPDGAEDDVCWKRVTKAVAWAKDAPRKDKPMAWLTNRIQTLPGVQLA